MKNIKGYYVGETYSNGNPPELIDGMVLKGRPRHIQDFVWTIFSYRILAVENIGAAYIQPFFIAAHNIIVALEKLFNEPCYTPIECSIGYGTAKVVNASAKWRWDIIKRTHDGRRRVTMAVSFRTKSDMELALAKIDVLEGLLNVPLPTISNHEYFNNTLGYPYRWKTASAPAENADSLFIAHY